MDKGEGKFYKFLRPRQDRFRGTREPWKLDLHTTHELRAIGLVLKPGVAADVMMHYVGVLRQHLCKPTPSFLYELGLHGTVWSTLLMLTPLVVFVLCIACF